MIRRRMIGFQEVLAVGDCLLTALIGILPGKTFAFCTAIGGLRRDPCSSKAIKRTGKEEQT